MDCLASKDKENIEKYSGNLCLVSRKPLNLKRLNPLFNIKISLSKVFMSNKNPLILAGVFRNPSKTCSFTLEREWTQQVRVIGSKT